MTGLWPAGWDRPVAVSGASPLILTLAVPAALQRAADAERRAGMAAAAAHAPAHLTLFRHLPGLQGDLLIRDAKAVANAPAPVFALQPLERWDGLWIAPVRSEALERLRDDLAAHWHGLLASPDMGRPRLHISLSHQPDRPPDLPPGPWTAAGLLMWQYDKAFWRPLVACRFRR